MEMEQLQDNVASLQLPTFSTHINYLSYIAQFFGSICPYLLALILLPLSSALLHEFAFQQWSALYSIVNMHYGSTHSH